VSHEGQRATDARTQEKADRAAPHWLNSLCSVSWRLEEYIRSTACKHLTGCLSGSRCSNQADTHCPLRVAGRNHALLTEGLSARHPSINLARLCTVPIPLRQEKVVAATLFEDAYLPAKLITANPQPQSLSDTPHKVAIGGSETERKGRLYGRIGGKHAKPEAEQGENGYKQTHGETEQYYYAADRARHRARLTFVSSCGCMG